MVRKVFFSFHYDRDVRRVVQIRNAWVIRKRGEAQPFYDKAEFEEAKSRRGGIKHWIEEQLRGTSVTAVLFGAETYTRKWVKYELERSHDLCKGILAIDIHKVRDPKYGGDVQGRNPLDYCSTVRNGKSIPFSSIYKTYDWIRDDGYTNLADWFEGASASARR